MTYWNRNPWDGTNAKIIGAILLLLLLLLLVGPAMDLFGDLGKNDITVSTDKIKVDLLDTSSGSLVGDVLDFVREDESKPLHFEPGESFYTEGFEVKNKGSIAIRFRIYINVGEEAEQDRFREAFEFYITTDPTDLEAEEKLTSFEGRLEPGESSDTYHLVVKMRETAGNEFQGKIYSGIGITVYAVEDDTTSE